MTATIQAPETAESEWAGPNSEVIRWGSGPVAFELRSPNAEIIDAAERVFGRWRPSDDATIRGRWEAHRSGRRITVTPRRPPEPGTDLQEIRDAAHAVAVVEYAAIATTVESCDDILCFHAALLSKNGRAVAIVGPSHAGKSTLAAGLWQSGWRFHCDDLTMIANGKTIAGPRRVALRNESRALVGDELWARIRNTPGCFETNVGCLFQPMDLDGIAPRNIELTGLIFLKRSGAVTSLEPTQLFGAHTALALLPYTNLIRTQSFHAALAPVAELAERVRAWDLPRGPLKEMVATVERLIAGAS